MCKFKIFNTTESVTLPPLISSSISCPLYGSYCIKQILIIRQNKSEWSNYFLLCLQTPSALPGFPQHLSLSPHSQQPLTPSQLPWLAQLAASSCGEGVLVFGEQMGSLAQGIQQTFNRLTEGRLENTNYVVIIVTAPGQETQSCVIVTGESCVFICIWM